MVCIDLRDMNRVLEVHAEDLDCVIEPGVTRKALNEHLRDQGLFFPIDPGADASLGGMASTRASGTNAVRYGPMRENVLALKVVARRRRDHHDRDAGEEILGRLRPDASVHRRRGHARHHLRAHHQIARHSRDDCGCGLLVPETVRGACQATILAIQTGIPVARIELLNAAQVRACNSYSKLSLPETPLLLLEFHGSAIEVGEQSKNFGEIAKECGGSEFTWTTKPEDRTKLWQARHDAYWSVKALRPGAGVVATDVCVPISRLADCVTETEDDLKRLGSAVADCRACRRWQFRHCSLVCDVDRTTQNEMARGEDFMHRLVERAPGDGRHLHRRTRRRPGQAEIPESRARPRSARRYARGQARVGPAEYFQPRKDRAGRRSASHHSRARWDQAEFTIALQFFDWA